MTRRTWWWPGAALHWAAMSDGGSFRDATRRRHAALAACAIAGLAGLLLAASTPNGPREVRVPAFNRVYSDLVGELAPFGVDPVTVRLSSPRQVVLVRDHVARLVALGGGRVEGTLEIELLGKGALVADVDLAGRGTRLADDLILPPQRLVLDGAARLERAENGYRVLLERLPPEIRVDVRSRLIDQVVGLCDTASLLSLGSIECAPVRGALERPAVRLDGAARELFLADTEIDAAARAELDALIAAPRR